MPSFKVWGGSAHESYQQIRLVVKIIVQTLDPEPMDTP